MKLILAIVQDEDSGKLVSMLMDQGFRATRLASTGGFLRSGNTTFMIGVENELLDACLGVIEKACKSRKQIATSPVPASGSAGMFSPYPIEVTVGGATVFITDVEERRF